MSDVVGCIATMKHSLHLIPSSNILYPYLIKFHYFISVQRLKEGLTDERKAQKMVTLEMSLFENMAI
jgi:hypothetical protein